MGVITGRSISSEVPLARIVIHILLKHHLPDNPSEQNQIDVEYFSKEDQYIDLLNFAVRENYIGETEMEEATKCLTQVVATRVDIWKEKVPTQNDSEALKQ
jgi:hypothetical protein